MPNMVFKCIKLCICDYFDSFFLREKNTEQYFTFVCYSLLPFTYQVSRTHIPSELIVYRKLLLGWSDLSSLNESFWWGKAKERLWETDLAYQYSGT